MARRPLIATPRGWTNQATALFHGTIDRYVPSILAGVDVTKGRRYTDFGRGFYTTTLERQARTWAWELSRQRPGSFPAVVRFDVSRDALAALDALWFVRGSHDAEDFWSLVFHCRSRGGDHGRGSKGWYDAIVGPVAASWRQRLSLHDIDQMSFHTERAAKILDASNPMVLP